jgi:hypothetical protein
MSARSVLEPLIGLVASDLGRCAHCMHTSAAMTVGAWAVLGIAAGAGAGNGLLFLLALPSAAFTLLSLAHGVAYVARGPERATGCKSCAERASARRRTERWQRRLGWLRPFPAPASKQHRRRSGGCRTCTGNTALESEDAAAALPSAEEGLRHVVERSPEFHLLLTRLASPEPADTWKVNMQSFFLYQLVPDANGQVPHAIFVTRWEDDVPVSAVILTPDPNGGAPVAVNLRTS